MASVLGVSLYNREISTAVAEVIRICITNGARLNHCVSATGAHGIVYAQKHPDFKQLLNEFYWNLPDGMPGVWVGRLKGEQKMRRCYGPEFFKEVMKQSVSSGIRHFFCGGKEGVAEELKVACKKDFKNQNVVGTFSPPFREMSETEWKELGDRINETGAEIVWIGISTPKQEMFAYRLRKYVKVHFIITVGAAFDFHTGKVKIAPKFMQAMGTEWLFRLLSEPKRLFARYFEIVPLFIYYNIKEFVYFCILKFQKNE